MSKEVDVATVSRTMEALLTQEGRSVVYRDRVADENLVVTPASAASPTGLLPAFLVAGEAVWREATGNGFALDIARDPNALLGYRLNGIGAGTFTTVMLAMMEAAAQVARPGAFVVNDLTAVWSAATERVETAAQPARKRAGAAP